MRAPVLVVLGILLGPTVLAPSVGAAAGDGPKRVLMVHSFGGSAPPFAIHSTAFETTLIQEMGRHVDLDEVSLDMARYAQPDMEEPFAEFLRKRRSKWRPDLVVPIGAPAGGFVARFRERLFPQTPVLYTGMNKRTLPPHALDNNAAFVGEDTDLAGLIEDILQVAPDTTSIVIVFGASPLERYWTDAFRRAVQPFTNRVRFTYVNDLSFDQLLELVSKLPPRSFVFLGLLVRDASGVTHNEDEALQRLHAVSAAPINGIYQHQLGLGIVGGRLYQGALEGAESARVAARILRGEPASGFPPKIIGPQGPRYDWRELQRWKISEDRLPPGSVVEFRQPTVWQRYGWWIAGTVGIVVVEAGSIALLALNLAKRRRVERALRESESRFRTVADSAPVLIWMSGADKRCTFFNQPWLQFTGRTAAEELGDGWTQGVHSDDLPGCLKGYSEAFNLRKPFVLQYRLRRHDGEYRWILDNGVPLYDAAGAFVGYIGSCSDVTERLQTEERFRQVFEAAPNAMIMAAADGRIVLVNAQVEQVFGYERTELIGRPIEALIPERFRPQHPDHRGRFASDARARPMGAGRDLFGLRKDGSEVPVEIGLNPIRTGEGLFVVASVIDISERRRTAVETQELRQELTHLSRVVTLGEMTAAIVHELGNPLAAIRTNAEAGLRLIAGMPDLKEIRETLEDIVSDNRRADHVIQRLRSLFKNGEVERQLLGMNELIHDTMPLMQSEAERRGASIVLDLAPTVPRVSGDRIQLQQVLLNVSVNAFEAMAEVPDRSRTVTLRTRVLADAHVQIDVADSGPGIAPERLSAIFDPFTTTKPSGMGMGLSVSRSIVIAHGGGLWAGNGPEGGAVFHIVLPVAPEDAM